MVANIEIKYWSLRLYSRSAGDGIKGVGRYFCQLQVSLDYNTCSSGVRPMRSYIVKENHNGMAVSKNLQYRHITCYFFKRIILNYFTITNK